MEGRGGGGGNTQPINLFYKNLNIIDENDFSDKILKLLWSHHHILPYKHNFHHY
jgi:hypothetical protein